MCLLLQKGALVEILSSFENKDKIDSNANVAQTSDEDSDLALTSTSFVCHSNEWIMDSA